MAADFTQDAVLHFLQRSGGSVRNTDLLLHFSPFIRDHADRDRNRELFKRFVNSVATVRQTDGVSYVFLRKKFKGHVPGSGGSSSGSLPAARSREAAARSTELRWDRAGQRGEESPAPPEGPGTKPILPAAGIVINNNVGANQEHSTPGSGPAQVPGHPQPQNPRVSGPAAPRQNTNPGKQRLDPGPLPGSTPPPGTTPPPNADRAQQIQGAFSRNLQDPATLRQNLQDPKTFKQNLQDPKTFKQNLQDPAAFRQNLQDPAAYKQNLQDPVGFRQNLQDPATLRQNLQDPATLRQNLQNPAALRQNRQDPTTLKQNRQDPTTLKQNLQDPAAFRQNLQDPAALRQNLQDPTTLRQNLQDPAALRQNLQDPATLKQNLQDPAAFRQNLQDPAAFRQNLQDPAALRQNLQDPAAFRQNLQDPAALRQNLQDPTTLRQNPQDPAAFRQNLQDPTAHRVPGPIRGNHQVPTSQQVPGALRGTLEEPPQQLLSQVSPRRVKHRQSYKTAVSYDEEEEEEEEEVVRVSQRVPAGQVWPLKTPLSDGERTCSGSVPCIVDPPAPPSVVSSSSSEKTLPKILIQDMEGEPRTPRGPGTGRGQERVPSEAERRRVSPHPGSAVPLESRPAPNQSRSPLLSSSHSSVFSPSPDGGFTSGGDPSSSPGSPGGSRWSGSLEDLPTRAALHQEPLQRVRGPRPASPLANGQSSVPWHHSAGNLSDEHGTTARLSPLHRSNDHLHTEPDIKARVMPWHLSTGDIYDEEAESSDGSASSPQMRPGMAKRLSTRLRNRMCRSLGADLDQLVPDMTRGGGEDGEGEEGRGGGGGNEAARIIRLHRISSSLSLHYNLSSSSLSSCSTPPRCQSLANLTEAVERKEERRSLPNNTSTSTSHPEDDGRSRQSLVPLEPREHAWLVKGAAGAWTDIYSLFREDPALLNRQDFISGFTVLHWIAKHGDHRVLNTLWYGVEKAGMTFDTEAKSTSGQTALHIAAIHGNKNILRLLVTKFKANTRVRDTAGKRPWQYVSREAPLEIFQLLGAPARAAVTGEGVGRSDASWEQQQRRRRRHHFSMASGERPHKLAGGGTKVKRSSSIAAFLKHKSLHRFYGHHSDALV